MKKIKALAIFNAISLLVQLSVAYFAQAKMISPRDVGEVSAKYESLFTPAGMTFGIWGIIYTTLLLLCLYHIVIAYKHDKPHPANTDLLRVTREGCLGIIKALPIALDRFRILRRRDDLFW